MTEELDESRRRFLGIATGATGVVGGALIAVPFLGSLKPSARAQALGAPVEINIASLEPGQMARKQWRGRTVYVLRRDAAMLKRIDEMKPLLADPDSASSEQPDYTVNEYRSLRPEVLVVFGSVRTSAAPPRRDSMCSRLILATTGWVVSSAPAMARSSTWRGAFLAACLHRPILRSRPTVLSVKV